MDMAAVVDDKPDRLGLTLLMNLTVYPLLILWTLLSIACVPLGLLLWTLLTRWPLRRVIRHFIWLYGKGWLLIISPFVTIEVEGRELHDWSRPGVVVVNHLSYFDTYFICLLPVHNLVFAVRAWPFRLLWYRWFMQRAGYLNVESWELERILAAGQAALDDRASLVFFPEGHRSRDGRVQRFYNGAFRVAHNSGAPVIPLCLSGTDRLLPPGRWYLTPTRIRLQFLPPVDPAQFTGETAARELQRSVRQQMAAALEAA